MRLIPSLTLLIAVVAATPLDAQKPQKLVGLTGYRVALIFQVADVNVDSATARATVELELRRAGIRVVGRDSVDIHLAEIDVLVQTLSVANARGVVGIASNVDLRVRRWLYIPSQNTEPILADVWSDGNFILSQTAAEANGEVLAKLRSIAAVLANEILAQRVGGPRN